MNVTFTIPGRLRGKGRPRVFMHPTAKRLIATTDPETRACESLVKDFASKAMGQTNPFQLPVELTISIRYMPTQSWPEKRKRLRYHACRPDLDNVVKLIKDAMNGIVWRDDAQVVKLGVVRFFRREEQEQTTIAVTEILEDERLL